MATQCRPPRGSRGCQSRAIAALALLVAGGLGAQEAPMPARVELAADTASAVDEPNQERVRYLDIDLQIRADGSLRITEKITVWAQHLQFKNGIYRDLGGTYISFYSGMKSVEPKVLSASLNGIPASYRSEPVAEGVRVYVAEDGTALGPGQHDFELHYELPDRVSTTLDSHLDWSFRVDWQVPVDRTQISIHLPPDVDRDSVRISATDGAQFERPERGPIWVVADGRLWPGDSIGFELSFAPGHSGEQSLWGARWRALPTGHRWAAAGLVGLWSYFLLIWWQVGRDPPPGPKVLSFAPPERISPGGLRLIEKLNYDPDCLVADLIALASSGQIRIERDAAGITVYRAADETPALAPLAKLKAALFDRSDSLRITRSNGSRLRQAVSRHRQALLAVHERQHFVSNFRYWWPGLVIAAATLGMLVLGQDSLEVGAMGAFMVLWLSGWSFGVYLLVSQAWMAWRSARGWGGQAGALFLTLFAIPFVIGELVGLAVFTATTGLYGLLIIVAALSALIIFYHWLKAPTAAGRRLLDQVQGLREHLGRFVPGGQQPGEIDAMVAYAYALGESETMAGRLREMLEESGAVDESPTWYRDATGSDEGLSEVAAKLGPRLNRALRAGLVKRKG